MKCAAFLFGEIIALVVRDQIDDGPLGQAGWFIQDQPAVLHAGSNTHASQFTAQLSTGQDDAISAQLSMTGKSYGKSEWSRAQRVLI